MADDPTGQFQAIQGTPDSPVMQQENMLIGHWINKLAHLREGFFVRQKSNYEWEVGWGEAAGPQTHRADGLLAVLRSLVDQYARAPAIHADH